MPCCSCSDPARCDRAGLCQCFRAEMESRAPGATDAERAAWLADKIGALGDYAKEAAAMLRRWPAGAEVWRDPDTGKTTPKPQPCSAEEAARALGVEGRKP